jgi:hypothetical protein
MKKSSGMNKSWYITAIVFFSVLVLILLFSVQNPLESYCGCNKYVPYEDDDDDESNKN